MIFIYKLMFYYLPMCFENFKEVDLDTYNLDPAHYVTGCSCSFDASLKKYKKKIELFQDEQSDMYLFVENAIRGGMSFIAHRHSIANNKYMKKLWRIKAFKIHHVFMCK